MQEQDKRFHDKRMNMNAEDLQMSYVFGPNLVSKQPFHQNVGGGRQQAMIYGGSRIRIAYKNRKESVKDNYANSEGEGNHALNE